ncbi:MAG: phenylacetate-CoA oxygenase/reductase subunit PaaK [Gammaproteobacteria bacterium]|nr:phenylacetate-CoA oxygenase/reductase subunit PaaK [Gammaproteobacteria bacterium]
MSEFFRLRVAQVRRETRDSVVLTLEPRPEEAHRFRHVQGQYLTCKAILNGSEIRRSYSICSAVGSTTLQVGIKHVPGGRFSSWANEVLAPGDIIEAMTPAGNFFLPLDSATARHYLAIAAGSGITPMMSILATTLAEEPRSRFTLLYGNRASPSIMFREALEDLKNRYLHRLNLVHVLTREQQDVALFNGRIDSDKCAALFKSWINIQSMDAAFLCGPLAMMEAVRGALLDHGMLPDAIKMELFEAPDALAPVSGRRGEDASTGAAGCQVRLIMHGRTTQLTLTRGEETVLQAGERAGLELPYSCRGGVCATCQARLLEGEVDMYANYALEDYEIARGYVLTCQAHPVTDRIVVDYDQ